MLVAAAGLGLGAVAFRTRPAPPIPALASAPPAAKAWDFKAEATAEEVFGHLDYTPPQSAALVEAGAAIFAGKQPTKTLSAASLEQLRQVRTMFEGITCWSPVPCSDYPRDVLACMDEAGKLVGLRLANAKTIDRALYTAAMGVSVVTREIPDQTPAMLAEFCRKLVIAREKVRPRRRTGEATRAACARTRAQRNGAASCAR